MLQLDGYAASLTLPAVALEEIHQPVRSFGVVPDDGPLDVDVPYPDTPAQDRRDYRRADYNSADFGVGFPAVR